MIPNKFIRLLVIVLMIFNISFFVSEISFSDDDGGSEATVESSETPEVSESSESLSRPQEESLRESEPSQEEDQDSRESETTTQEEVQSEPETTTSEEFFQGETSSYSTGSVSALRPGLYTTTSPIVTIRTQQGQKEPKPKTNVSKTVEKSTIVKTVTTSKANPPAKSTNKTDPKKSKVANTQEEDSQTEPKRQLPKLVKGDWQPLFEMGETIYPSVAISTATLKEGLWNDSQHIGDPWGLIGIVVRGKEKNCPIRVEISGSNFIKPSVFTSTLLDDNKLYCVYPDLQYDYEKLLAVKQTVPDSISFKVRIGNEDKPEKIVRVQVRPVNECVYSFQDSSGNDNDISFLFAAYVNENHPIISQIMKESIMAKRVDDFVGYSGDKDSVRTEVEAIWETLRKRGMHYSTMTASADDDNPYISSQYVRLLGESINYTQANCVDGSVLMASIFRKIGLDVSLIELPEHMFISVSLDEQGKDVMYIETTDLSDSAFEEAITDGYEAYADSKDKFDSEKEEDQGYNIVNVQSARVLGVMPIKDVF